MNSAPLTNSDSAVFGIPMTHLRSSVIELSSLLSVGVESEIGTFVGGIHEFVGDQPNRLLKCLESERFYAAILESEKSAQVEDPFSQTDIWPIVFFGDPGTGKTSLALTVISNLIQRRHANTDVPASKPVCMSGSDFFRRFRAAIDTQSVEEFRERILSAPGLVIDNLEQLENKETTQQELILLVDQLAASDRPVVFTMSCSPQSNERLVQKLVSRLSGGLCLPTFPPGRQARFELAQKLAEVHQLNLTDEALNWVAERLVVTVPKLNHFFIQLVTKLRSLSIKDNSKPASPQPVPDLPTEAIDVFTLAKIFQRDDSDHDQLVHLIQTAVAEEFHLKPSQLKSKSRKQTIVLARGVAIYLQREMLGTSFLKIGESFGNRDHSTIMHSYRKIESIFTGKDSATKRQVVQLKLKLNEQFANLLSVIY